MIRQRDPVLFGPEEKLEEDLYGDQGFRSYRRADCELKKAKLDHIYFLGRWSKKKLGK